MDTPPPLHTNAALFLDFDGTLVELAETPEAIELAPTLVALLAELSDLLAGALAIVTGRQIEVLDRFLAPLRLPAACEHGVQRRDAHGRLLAQIPPGLDEALHLCESLARSHPTLLVERKRASIALHYRRAQGLQALCRQALGRVLQGRPQLELLQGKCVLEVKRAGVNKGEAIAAFLREPPFAGRTPVFAGDDSTDESGFAVVQAHAGIAIKIGSGPTLARHRLDCVPAVHAWLRATRARLAAQACAETGP